MAVVYDTVTTIGDVSTNQSFTHTPIGIPRGVLLLVGGTNDADGGIASCTYGGISLTQLAGSPLLAATESGAWAFFLGSGIPTGAQTVTTTTPAGGKHYICSVYTVTGGNDTEIHDIKTSVTTAANPSATLVVSLPSFCAAVLGTGNTSPATAGSNTTADNSVDLGAFAATTSHANAIQTSNFAYGFTVTSNPVALFVVAITQKNTGLPNNYQSVDAGDGMSVTEKIK